jgi:outer membrane protein TolC
VLLVLGGGLFLAHQAGWLSWSSVPSSPQHPGPEPILGRDASDAGKAPPIAPKKPVAKERLEELRRLVKVQQENLEQVQLTFNAGKITTRELCAAEDLLIEARIKLATAEQKSVVALLEHLVRNCEEELRVTQERVDAGADTQTELLSATARLSEARTRLATARAESPETKR